MIKSNGQVSSLLTNDGVSAAHQLGHAIGFVHDDLLGQQSGLCDCNCTSMPGHCIMHSTTAECHRLSNCSKSVYYEFLQRPDTTCLLNIPTKIYEMKLCGNAIVEGSEECDCGKNEECQRNGCCRVNCTLKPGIDCLHGACCETCQFAPEGRICREAATECELPEYCTGSSADCPPDVYKQDGMPCGTNDNCYRGKCRNLHRHCRNIFGPGANRAPLSCYKELNMRGDRTGNCGQEKQGYKKCREEDVLCGRLQCTNIKTIPVVSTGQAIVQTPMGNALCWGTEFHGGEHAYDVGAIRDGSTCGAGKICINRACVDLKVLNFDCNFSKCNNQGVCNNNKNCHCMYGWAPPNCSGRGYGGSIDSGPPPGHRGSKGYVLLGSGIGVAIILMTLTAKFKQYLPPRHLHAPCKRPPPLGTILGGACRTPAAPLGPLPWDAKLLGVRKATAGAGRAAAPQPQPSSKGERAGAPWTPLAPHAARARRRSDGAGLDFHRQALSEPGAEAALWLQGRGWKQRHCVSLTAKDPSVDAASALLRGAFTRVQEAG
ncbi:disintegrin and metalloproteinase domain-containing protein 30-like [Tiliqua scincoides]|uniref:disintegrin and metalloproteinase domain-containing protein 30-like n=1 Tax=Tiliqua scincoides TaxID=71010 RepID=UPI003462CF64